MIEFEPLTLSLILICIFLAALLYSSVGHGGASGYLAVMSLFAFSSTFMKPAALSMNIAVAGFVFVRLYRAGYFNTRLFLPFALASIPMAYLGGIWIIHASLYKYIVAAALFIAAIWLLMDKHDPQHSRHPHWAVAVPVGGVLGLLSGLTGVGGGIFLSPLLLLLRWTTMRENAAMAAAFVLVNSIAGLLGFVSNPQNHYPYATISVFVIAALLGGFIGAELAVRRLAPLALKKLLALVLLIAAVKMAFGN